MADGSPSGAIEPKAPSGARRSRRRLGAVVALAVAVAVVVAALAATGVLRLGSAESGSGPGQTFFEASNTAQSGADPVSGGPWFAVAAWGVVTRVAVLEPTENLSSLITSGNCTLAWLHGEPANLEIPATPTSAGPGASAYWGFLMKNASNGLLILTVGAGTATALVTLGGPECAQAVGYLDTFGPGLQDSSTIVGAVNAAGGSQFLREYPNATQAWLLIGTFAESTLPFWTVEDTSCALPTSISAQGAFFNATVIATTATLRGPPQNGTADCALSVAYGTSLARALPSSAPPALRKAI